MTLPRAVAAVVFDMDGLVFDTERLHARAALAAAKEIGCPLAERLGVAPRDCLSLEDSLNGVRSASAAGMMTVMVPDLIQPTAKVRSLCAAVAASLLDVQIFSPTPPIDRREYFPLF